MAPQVDVTYWPREIDALLAETENPKHRAMLLNMRRHILLEISGRWREVLAPDMTVEEPVYRVGTPHGTLLLEGMAAVKGFYEQLWDTGSGVWSPLEEYIVVSDHGVIGESHLAAFRPGSALTAEGRTDVDPNGTYIDTFYYAFVFDYAPDGRLLGERAYDGGLHELYEIPESDVITFDEAARIVKPYLDNPPA